VQAREHGVRAVWVFLPTLEMHGTPGDIAWMRDLAREAGFETIDLFDVYDGQDIFQIRVADWDYHPNAAGHQIIADLLLAELLARPELFR
jgi:lysophospholipase L1-like esterase